MLNPVKGKGRVLEEKLVGCCVGRRRYAERRRRIEQTSGERGGDMTGQFLFPLIAVSFY